MPSSGRSPLLALPPELRNRIYELVLVDMGDKIIDIYPETDNFVTRPYLWQPALTRVSREVRHETLAIFYGQNSFRVPLTSDVFRSVGVVVCSDAIPMHLPEGYSLSQFNCECLEGFEEFVEKWFRTNTAHLKLIKTLSMDFCYDHNSCFEVAVSGCDVQSTIERRVARDSHMYPELDPSDCWALDLGESTDCRIAERVESILGPGAARQPHLTLDVCLGLLDLAKEQYGFCSRYE
ncbi:hypothetical protein B0A54_16556 [Friedmanniomyces endolithicus]|uniref:2EXR domain-containing protein n=1 Tax=Friedmanniomyces endolithicus TaxID=329885 RepID=A0A4U0TW15_9PEZI|nr:hypothetical protein LTS09_017021 [Friedmanniomyces endolithicus]TKA26571.1 hypothetical protein B0A54_16556 [Friedmanniomyces endolithicus]